jgi:two-component system, chemotaxis family, protein-glutamate methylesterase/glutaminase
MTVPVVGIAASAGGPSALAEILPHLAGLPATVMVVQHLDPRFADGFLEWMARVSALPLESPRPGLALLPGVVYVAAPGAHLRLGPGRRAVVDRSPASVHRPSADQLFLSIAEHAGRGGVGVVLSGMGDDGAIGLQAIHRAGGTTLVQDRGSSAVYGMPLAAERLEAVDATLTLAAIPAAIRAAVRSRSRVG